MAKKRILDDWKSRSNALHMIRNTGTYSAAAGFLGISEKTLERYRETHPEFEQACLDAKNYHTIMRQIQYGGALRQKALKCLEKRIEDDSISDMALIKVLYERDKHDPTF